MRLSKPVLLACLALATTGTAALAVQRGPARAARPAVGFTISIAFSPRAAAEMARRREGLVVSAWWEGTPLRAYRRHAGEDGSLNLGSETINAPGRAGRVVVTGRGFRADRLAWIERRDAQVTVNVFSARRSGRDNLLDCGLVAGPFRQIAGRTHQLRCKLIGEP